MPWMSWSPAGDRLAYFVRTEKERTLIVQNVLTKKIDVRIAMKAVDEPESPTFSPDGKTIAFAALKGAIGDIYTIDLATGAIANLTNDEFADSGPTYSPDGSFIVYNLNLAACASPTAAHSAWASSAAPGCDTPTTESVISAEPLPGP